MAVAPRKAPQATVNETLRDRGVAHAVYLERLKAGVAARIMKQLNDEVIPDLTEQLLSRLAMIDDADRDVEPKVTARLRSILNVLEESVDAWTSGLAQELADEAVEIGAAEVAWQDDLLKTVLPIAWDTVIPATAILNAAILQSPIDGVLLEDIVARLGAASKANVEKAIRIGIAEGEGIDRIASRILKATDLTVASAEAVARTAVGHAANAGRAAYYSDNTDLIKAVQWVATLDTRTCASCGALDGKTFDVDKGPRPPRHINCRCTSVPVLRSMKELGLPFADFTPTQRASMNGQVAASETFNTWLAKMPRSVQDEALGPTRGKLFRTGKIDVRDFTDRGGDPYTLVELAKREKAAWAAAAL